MLNVFNIVPFYSTVTKLILPRLLVVSQSKNTISWKVYININYVRKYIIQATKVGLPITGTAKKTKTKKSIQI